ncbi:MAG: hypothetical protein FD146_2052 [Anaerolineaceae bacterium]|nr:MAG: hypothetical protein FD146_2052 [Anaerolineaceae bacterium]
MRKLFLNIVAWKRSFDIICCFGKRSELGFKTVCFSKAFKIIQTTLIFLLINSIINLAT